MIARHAVTHIARHMGDRDTHGNPVITWAEPVRRPVFGWHQLTAEELTAQGINRSMRRLAVLADWTPAIGDRITVLGETFEVDGEPEDWNHGPFAFAPGYRFYLKVWHG